MSESKIREERVQLRQAQEEAVRKMQDEQIDRTLAVFRKDYEGIKNLLKENNPTAWTSLMFLRGKMRRFRNQWRAKLTDVKVPENERNVLIGQINAGLLLFDVIDQIVTINKDLIPGKEKEILREKLFRRPNPNHG